MPRNPWDDPPEFAPFTFGRDPGPEREEDFDVPRQPFTSSRQAKVANDSDPATYDDFLWEAMRYGYERSAIKRYVPGLQEETVGGVKRAIRDLERYVAPDYSDYKLRLANMEKEAQIAARKAGKSEAEVRRISYAPVSPVQWGHYPGQLRQRRLQGVPVQYDENNQPIIPEGHMYRKDGAFTYPTGVLRASFMGRIGDRLMSTFAPSKLMKRVQMLGAHQQVFLSGKPIVTSDLTPGGAEYGRERGQNLRGALVIGGDVGPAGMGYMDPRVGNVTERTVKTVSGRGIRPVDVGTSWERGEHVQLAEGLSGFRDKEWGYKVLDVMSRPSSYTEEGEPDKWEHRYVMERSAKAGEVAFAGKNAYQKVLYGVKDLSNITNMKGQSMDLDFIAGLKDVQGAAYSMLQSEWTQSNFIKKHWIARELGYSSARQAGQVMGPGADVMPESVAELGDRNLKRLTRKLPELVQDIIVPTVVHKNLFENPEFAPIYESSMVGNKQVWRNPITGEADPDRFLVNMRRQALVGDFFSQYMKEYDVKRGTIGYEDLENLKRTNPRYARRLERASARTRSAYRDVINATLASGGTGRKLKGPVVSARDEDFQAELMEAIGWAETEVMAGDINRADVTSLQRAGGIGPKTAQAIVDYREEHGPFESMKDLINVKGIGESRLKGLTEKLRIIPGSDPKQAMDQSLVSKKFFEYMSRKGAPYSKSFVQWGSDEFITAPFRSAGYFAAEGQAQESEISSYLNAIFGMSKSTLNKEAEPFFGYRDIAMEEQRKIAESEQGLRRAQGVTPGTRYLEGYKVLGLEALGDNEMYIPGRDPGEAGFMIRFPTQGEESFSRAAQGVTVSKEVIEGVGLDPNRMYVSLALQQAAGGDFDADISYALMTGEATYRKGKWYDSAGVQIDAAKVREIGKKRVQFEGAGALSGEIATGTNKKVDGQDPLQRAIAAVAEKATAYHSMTESEAGDIVEEGRKAYSNIGPWYNNMRKLFYQATKMPGNVGSLAMAGVQAIWNRSHGFAQRPANPPADTLDIHALMGATAWGKAFRREIEDWGSYGSGTVRNLSGLRKESAEKLSVLVNQGLMSAEQAGALMSGGDKQRAKTFAGIFSKYSEPGKSFMITPQLMKSGQTAEEWALESVMGQAVGGAWAGSIKRKSERDETNIYSEFKARSVEPALAQELIGRNEEMNLRLVALKKGAKSGFSIEEQAAALEQLGMADWLAAAGATQEATTTPQRATKVPAAPEQPPHPVETMEAGDVAAGAEAAIEKLKKKRKRRAASQGGPVGQQNPLSGRDAWIIGEGERIARSIFGDRAKDILPGGFVIDRSIDAALHTGGTKPTIRINPDYKHFAGEKGGIIDDVIRHELGHAFGDYAEDALSIETTTGRRMKKSVLPGTKGWVFNEDVMPTKGKTWDPRREVFADIFGAVTGAKRTGYLDLQKNDPNRVAAFANTVQRLLAKTGFGTTGGHSLDVLLERSGHRLQGTFEEPDEIRGSGTRINSRMRGILYSMNYPPNAINQMSPDEAQDIISQGRKFVAGGSPWTGGGNPINPPSQPQNQSNYDPFAGMPPPPEEPPVDPSLSDVVAPRPAEAPTGTGDEVKPWMFGIWGSGQMKESVRKAISRIDSWSDELVETIGTQRDLTNSEKEMLKVAKTFSTEFGKLQDAFSTYQQRGGRSGLQAMGLGQEAVEAIVKNMEGAGKIIEGVYGSQRFEGKPQVAGALAAVNAREELLYQQNLYQSTGGKQGIAPTRREGGPSGQLGSALDQMLQEFSFGGAYFRWTAAERVFGQPVNKAMAAAGGLAGAQLNLAAQLGGGAESIMQSPIGRIIAAQAQGAGFQQGFGMSMLQGQAGVSEIISDILGGGSTYAAGERVGAALGPALKGLEWGSKVGIGATVLNRFGSTIGGRAGEILGGLGGKAGVLALATGGIVAGANYLGQAYQAGAPENVYREITEAGMALQAGEQVGSLLAKPGSRFALPFKTALGLGARTIGGLFQGEDYKESLEAGTQAYLKSGQFSIDRAQIHIEQLDIPGLDPERKAEVFGYLAQLGYGAEDIYEGRLDAMARRLGPAAIGGQLEGQMSTLNQISQYLGLGPGVGMQALQGVIPMDIAGQRRFMMASGVSGQLQSIGVGTTGAMLQGYSNLLAGGTTLEELSSIQAARYGMQPIVSAMGYTPGSPVARLISQALGPQTSAAGGAQAQIASQYRGYADIQGMGPVEAAKFYAGLQKELEGKTFTSLLGIPGQEYYLPPNITPEQQLRRTRAEAGVGAAQAYGFPEGSEAAKQFMRAYPWRDATQAGIFDQAATLAGQVYQYQGDYTQGTFTGMTRRGVSPQAQGLWQQSFMGQGAVAGAFGMPAAVGRGFESGLRGAMAYGGFSAADYTGMAQIGGFAASQLGYSAALGALGPEAQATMGNFYGAMGMDMPTGTPLHEQWGGGIYTIGTRAKRALARNQLVQAQQYRMGRGQWATQTVTPWTYDVQTEIGSLTQEQTQLYQPQIMAAQEQGLGTISVPTTVGGQTYQMGLTGQLGRMQLKLQQSRELYGMQAAAAAMSASHQQAGIQRAMESARLQYRHAGERLDVGYRQSQASLEQGYAQQQASMALSRRMWGTQTEFQRQQFGVQWQQMMQAQQWGREDQRFARERAGVQYERQAEDMTRSIRYARGRERVQLIRERERMEEDYTVGEKRRGVEEGRQEKMWAQQASQFEAQTSHFEDIKQLETEQFELQKQHMTQNYELQKQHMTENYELSKRQLEESFDLQMKHLQAQMGEAAAMAEMQQAIAAKQQEIAEDDMMYRIAQMEQEIKYYDEVVHPGQLQQQALQEDVEDAYAKYLKKQTDDMSKGGALWNEWDGLISRYKNTLRENGSLDWAWKNMIDRFEDYVDELFKPPDPPPNAFGGDVYSGKPTIVGELGPELFVPDSNGTIVPNIDIRGSSSGVSVGNMTISITVQGGTQDERTLASEIWKKFEQELEKTARSQRARGKLWQ